MYRILHYLYTYSTGSRSGYKYSNVVHISQSYLSHMYHGCVSPSIFDECYSINCALHHVVECPIVLTMRVKCYWLAMFNNTLGAHHQSHQSLKKHQTGSYLMGGSLLIDLMENGIEVQCF
jgi:hypothetical protein